MNLLHLFTNGSQNNRLRSKGLTTSTRTLAYFDVNSKTMIVTDASPAWTQRDMQLRVKWKLEIKYY